jgi:dolichyl-phosphate beta-glucosyltransferase
MVTSKLSSNAPPASVEPGAISISVAAPARPECVLSIVVPAYNEESRLPATLRRIAEYLSLRDSFCEVLLVDDGSRDDTRQLVRNFAARCQWLRPVHYDLGGHPVNRGKGFAVRQGVLHAVGREVLFSDADLSTPLAEMDKLLALISRGSCEVAIASRALPDSTLLIHQPWYRETMGRTFNRLVRAIAVRGVMDTQCGFKAFAGHVARRLFSLACVDGFGFDVEILFLAQKFGYRICEVPVRWEHREESRVSLFDASLEMMRELITIRVNDLRGAYDHDQLGLEPARANPAQL